MLLLKLKFIKLILTTNFLLNLEIEKWLANKANNSKVKNWLSDIQIEIDKCVMTIYEYDGFKISIDTKPKQIKLKKRVAIYPKMKNWKQTISKLW